MCFTQGWSACFLFFCQSESARERPAEGEWVILTTASDLFILFFNFSIDFHLHLHADSWTMFVMWSIRHHPLFVAEQMTQIQWNHVFTHWWNLVVETNAAQVWEPWSCRLRGEFWVSSDNNGCTSLDKIQIYAQLTPGDPGWPLVTSALKNLEVIIFLNHWRVCALLILLLADYFLFVWRRRQRPAATSVKPAGRKSAALLAN